MSTTAESRGVVQELGMGGPSEFQIQVAEVLLAESPDHNAAHLSARKGKYSVS